MQQLPTVFSCARMPRSDTWNSPGVVFSGKLRESLKKGFLSSVSINLLLTWVLFFSQPLSEADPLGSWAPYRRLGFGNPCPAAPRIAVRCAVRPSSLRPGRGVPFGTDEVESEERHGHQHRVTCWARITVNLLRCRESVDQRRRCVIDIMVTGGPHV